MDKLREPGRMQAAAETYLQIKEWMKLEADLAELRRQLESATTENAKAEIAAAGAKARADRLEVELAALKATQAAEEKTEGEEDAALKEAQEDLAEAQAARQKAEASLATETAARIAAEARLAAAPPKAPPPTKSKPISIVYDVRRDAAGMMTKIIATEKP